LTSDAASCFTSTFMPVADPGAASCLTSYFTACAARARKLTPAEEGWRKVADLEDIYDAALVGAEDALDTEKSRGASTCRPVRRVAVTS
jgi:hypothetical protein